MGQDGLYKLLVARRMETKRTNQVTNQQYSNGKRTNHLRAHRQRPPSPAGGKQGRQALAEAGIHPRHGGQYPRKVCFSLFGESITKFPLQVGQDVTVSIDIESREWNSKWYTEVRAWNVTYASQQPQLQAQAAPQSQVAQPAPSTPPQQQPSTQPQAADDLPF